MKDFINRGNVHVNTCENDILLTVTENDDLMVIEGVEEGRKLL